jgi:MOSC domain-containing protein YiiM
MPFLAPQVLSVNIGPATPTEHSKVGATGIVKRPTAEPVQVSAPGPRGTGGSGLQGDRVCDLRHHGGDDHAVYAYAREDLDRWQERLGRPLADGGFGENLTTIGIDVSAALVGETWSVGATLLLQVSDPRIPCRTFAGFMTEPNWIRRFTEAGHPGTYLRVLRPGAVRVGDPIQVLDRPDHDVTVQLAFRALTSKPELLPRLTVADGLSAHEKAKIARRTGFALQGGR